MTDDGLRAPPASTSDHHQSVGALIEQNAAGTLTGWSPEAEALFGWTAAEAIGRRSHTLIPVRNRDRHDKELKALASEPEGNAHLRIITGLHKDGHEFAVEFTINAVIGPRGPSLVAIARQSARPARFTEDALGTSNDRFRHVLDQIEDGCCVIDLRGNFLFVNDAFCHLFGFTREFILGRNFKASMGVERADKLRDLYTHVYTTGEPVKSFAYQIFPQNSPVRHVEQTISLERNEDGKPIGFLAITRDCTARKQAELEAAGARKAAEAANRAKGEFLANVSHEIRTPMNGIIGMTELALDTDLTPYQQDCLATVKSSAESLLTLLNDILDFSKIESGKLELEVVPFGLGDMVGETLRPLALRADQKGLELIVDIAPDVPAGLIGDPGRLRQVLTNLLGNAVKFTERGHVLLTIRVEAPPDSRARLRFEVADTGIGIPAEKHARIFESFSQADGSTTRRFGGTGLGLTISSTLVQLMGGRIGVNSEPGSGSTFHFTIDLDMAQVGEPSAVRANLTGLHVLIVDDNDMSRRIFEAQVIGWHMLPTSVEGGRAALETLTSASRAGRRFSLVLLDANMPDLDGFDVAREIAKRPDLADATIMMLTASGQYGEIQRCRELGIAAYLTKPIRRVQLYEAICRALDGVSAVRRISAPPAGVPRLARAIKVLLAEDNIVNQRVAIGLLTKRGHHVTVAANGNEALAALEREPFDLVLMDVQMPEMGGFEATAAIRARERTTGTHVRIIAMTAHVLNGDRERCLRAGMDGYLAKPIKPHVLFSVVEGESPAPPSARPDMHGSAINREDALRIMGGDEGLLADVVRLFLDDCPRRLAAIKAAVDARNAELIRTEAHALNGAAGNLSATSLCEAARTLEQIGAERRLDAAEAAWSRLSTAAADVLDQLRRLEMGESAAACAVTPNQSQ